MQENLLRAAVDMLRPGGTLVYCTCSLEPEEGPRAGRGAAALGRAGRAPADRAGRDRRAAPNGSPPAGDLRTLPCHLAEYDGVDGFYGARLVKLALIARDSAVTASPRPRLAGGVVGFPCYEAGMRFPCYQRACIDRRTSRPGLALAAGSA